MYEDSQRFSEEEEGEGSRIVILNPRSTAVCYDNERQTIRHEELERQNPWAFMMKHGVHGDSQPPMPEADVVVETPEVQYANVNLRQESVQRISDKLTPTGRQSFLRMLSGGEENIEPPQPFLLPDTSDVSE